MNEATQLAAGKPSVLFPGLSFFDQAEALHAFDIAIVDIEFTGVVCRVFAALIGYLLNGAALIVMHHLCHFGTYLLCLGLKGRGGFA